MMDDFDDIMLARTPTAARPLLGLTVLVVEDSRFASEAMRLLCLRSGARIRRADCLTSARKHLRVYRPSVVVVDLGLPDGSGTDLIAELHNATPRIDVLLGISGDPLREGEAMAAGADGFLPKPIETLGVFQQAILSLLPETAQPPAHARYRTTPFTPTRLPFARILPARRMCCRTGPMAMRWITSRSSPAASPAAPMIPSLRLPPLHWPKTAPRGGRYAGMCSG